MNLTASFVTRPDHVRINQMVKRARHEVLVKLCNLTKTTNVEGAKATTSCATPRSERPTFPNLGNVAPFALSDSAASSPD